MSFLGVNIENDIVQPIITNVVQPIVNGITGAITATINAAINGFDFLGRVVNPILSSIARTFTSELEQFFGNLGQTFNTYVVNPIRTFIRSDVIPFFSSVVSSVETSFNTYIVSPIRAAISDVSGFVRTTILPALNGAWSTITSVAGTIGTAVLGGLAQIGKFFVVDVPNFFHDAYLRLDQLGHSIYDTAARIGTMISNAVKTTADTVAGAVSNTFNAIGNDIKNTVTSGFSFLTNIGQTLWRDLTNFMSSYIKPFLSTLGHDLGSALTTVNRKIANGIIALLPKTPDQAISSAVLAIEVGLADFLVGEVAALAVEEIQPLKHQGIPEAFHKGLELIGVTEVAAAMYGIIVESGWGQQLRYYFNYNIQPRKIDIATAKTAVWYGVRDLGQFQEDLRYEGFNQDAIDAYTKTLYRPMSAFILEKLIELQVVDNAFALKQLNMSGFSPEDSASLLKAFQNLSLNAFQANAKSIIFQLYKDGFIDESTANTIMTVFAVPKDQQAWILQMAKYQFAYEQKLELRTLIIDEVKKGIITPDDAVNALIGIGMNEDRAKVLVEIAGITTAAALTKAEKAQVLQETLAIGQVASS